MKTIKTLFHFGSICKAIAIVIICMAFYGQVTRAGNYDPKSITSLQASPNPTPGLVLTLVPHVYPNGYNISCTDMNDGSLDLTVSGGTPPYTYLWSTDETTQDIGNLSATYYKVDVYDENGNSASADINLTQPEPDQIPEVNTNVSEYSNGYNISCYGCCNGSIDITVIGGGLYSYEWTDGPTTEDRYGLCAGYYEVIIRGMSECNNGQEFSRSFELTEPESPYSQSQDWTMYGNSGTTPGNQFLGTTDNKDFVFKTNSNERLRINANGNVGIGTNNPTEKLTVTGNGKITDNFSVGKKMEIAGSLKIDSLGGEGFKTDSISNKSYRHVLVDNYGQLVAPEIFQRYYPPCENITDPWNTNGNIIGSNLPSRIGTCDNREFEIMTHKQTRMFITNDGKVGIGTLEPLAKLDLYSTFTAGQQIPKMISVNTLHDGKGSVGFLVDLMGEVFTDAGFYLSNDLYNDPADAITNAIIKINRSGITINESSLTIAHRENNISTVNFKVLEDGNVYAREVTVQTGPFPDYVFAKEYDLKPLSDVENYIDKHNHLPDVPSADDVNNYGLKLGDMNKILLQKIEELTLYIIEINKQVELLKIENAAFKRAINNKLK